MNARTTSVPLRRRHGPDPRGEAHVSAPTRTVGYVGSIPVRNLWLLMLYGSRLFRELPAARRYAAEENPDDIPDLVAEILVRAVQRRLRRNLSAELQVTHADLTRVRGRIDHLRTRRHSLLERGRVACVFDELTTDTPRNRHVLAALHKLLQTVSDGDLARRCRSAAGALERAGVKPQQAGRPQSARTLSHAAGRVNSEDRQMLAAARLAFRLRLPTEDCRQRIRGGSTCHRRIVTTFGPGPSSKPPSGGSTKPFSPLAAGRSGRGGESTGSSRMRPPAWPRSCPP